MATWDSGEVDCRSLLERLSYISASMSDKRLTLLGELGKHVTRRAVLRTLSHEQRTDARALHIALVQCVSQPLLTNHLSLVAHQLVLWADVPSKSFARTAY